MRFGLTVARLASAAWVGAAQGIVVIASLLLIGYWLRSRRLLTWTKTPLTAPS